MNSNNPSNFIRILRKYREHKRQITRLEHEVYYTNDSLRRETEKLHRFEQKYGRICREYVQENYADDKLTMCINIDKKLAKKYPQILDQALHNLEYSIKKVL